MERYFKKKRIEVEDSNSQECQSPHNPQVSSNIPPTPSPTPTPSLHANLDDIPGDPGLRKSIYTYDVNDRERVRRAYLQRGPCQPKNHVFPWRQFGKEKRRFIPLWFNEHGNWLEYSIAKDAAFCLCCYLFKPEHGEQGGGDSFVGQGFTNWKTKGRLNMHVGDHNSIHNKCVMACEDLMKQSQHIEVCLSNQSDQARIDYRIRLTASVDCIRFLLCQGLSFRGHDESVQSRNRGNFLELLQWYADHDEIIKQIVLKNAPKNLKMIAPKIQKDIVNACAVETTNAILSDMGDELFSILVDESHDISVKEQMAVVLRYVDKRGCIIERFLGIVHVADTTALSLKAAIESLFATHGLSMSRLRGQGYDGASNMQAVAKNHKKIGSFFNLVTNLSNIVGASCKRRDILREKQFEKVFEGICSGEIMTGRGLNQEATLKRVGDTRWGSHYNTLLSLIVLFASVIDVLEVVENDGAYSDQRAEASDVSNAIQSFEFAFKLHLMKTVLGITNELSQTLQRRNQDIVNAMILVNVSKQRLQNLRDEGWENLMDEVSLFCTKHDIIVLNMEDLFVLRGRSRRNAQETTNLHHYRVELFYTVIDMQLQELNSRFNEVSKELLLCMASLDPSNSFSAFDKRKLLRFAKLYPLDFSPIDLMVLDNQLETYIVDMRSNDQFSQVMGIGGLAQKLVETKKDIVYPLVYLLVKSALILPVVTASAERAFSAMKIIKTSLRNRMGDE